MKPCGVQFARPMRPPLAQHAQHLVRRAGVIGREHRAEGGQHDVEAAVGKGQRLGIGGLEVDLQTFGLRPGAALVEQGRHVVGRGDLGEASRRGQRGIAVAGGHVEHALAGAHVDGFGQLLADDLQGGADDGDNRRWPRWPAGVA